MIEWFLSLFKSEDKKDTSSKQTVIYDKSSQEKVPSLGDLEKVGIKFIPKPIPKIGKEKTLLASQIPPILAPWISLLGSGTYQVTFSPKVMAGLKSGTLKLMGGNRPTAVDSLGQIVSQGAVVSPFVAHAPLLIYQAGSFVFGAYHLKHINESLSSIVESVDEIMEFQENERESRIRAYFQEFLHLSKGIIDFQKQGNMEEVSKRLLMIKDIRYKNLADLIHLEKDIKHESEWVKHIEDEGFVGSRKNVENLHNHLHGYVDLLLQYKRSLFLSIISTQVEVFFSQFTSHDEVQSRIDEKKRHLKFGRDNFLSFEKTFKGKVKELIDSILGDEDEEKSHRRELRLLVKGVKENLNEIHEECENRIHSMEKHMIDSKSPIFIKVDKKAKLVA